MKSKNKFFTKEEYLVGVVDKPQRRSFVDLEGLEIDKIVVRGWAGQISREGKKPINMWWCTCSCDVSKYFMVHSTSLQKGLTRSCGCLRKLNKFGDSFTKEEFQETLKGKFNVISYRGMNHPCTVTCTSCGVSHNKPTGYSVRQSPCGCMNVHEDKTTTFLSNNNYKLISKLDNSNHKVMCLMCNLKISVNIFDLNNSGCLCRKDSAEGRPSAVYLLANKDMEIKIGYSFSPLSRCSAINIDAASYGIKSKWEVVREFWFINSNVAFYVERLLHNRFKSQQAPKQPYDGGTEIFIVGVSEVSSFLEESEELNKYMCDPPEVLLHTYEKTSVEWNGLWWPSKVSIKRFFNLSDGEVDFYLKHQDLITAKEAYTEFMRLNQDKIKKEREEKYGADWGDGIFGTVRGLAREYGLNAGTLLFRISQMGLSMKEALRYKDTKEVFEINGKEYLKKEWPVPWYTVNYRLNRGWEFKYAILQLNNPIGRLFNIEGEVMTLTEVKQKYGIKKIKWGDVYDHLINHKIIDNSSYFEIINLP